MHIRLSWILAVCIHIHLVSYTNLTLQQATILSVILGNKDTFLLASRLTLTFQ